MYGELIEFCDEVRKDPRTADLADDLENALRALFDEGDSNADAVAMLDAIRWVARHRRRTWIERFYMIGKLLALPGKVRINLRAFTGWGD